MSNQPIGEGTTTLDYLYYKYPWLKAVIEDKDRKILDLQKEISRCQEILRAHETYFEEQRKQHL